MEKHQANIKYKLFSCVIALSLVFGISAMPAFAAPSADEAESGVSTQSESTDNSESTNAIPVAVNPDSSWGEEIKEEASQGSTEEETLNPLETFTAVTGAEAEILAANALDGELAPQSNGDPLSVKKIQASDIRATVLGSNFGTYDNPFNAQKGASLTIKKAFPDDQSTIVSTPDQVENEKANYTVSFSIKGIQTTKDGAIVYQYGDGNWFKAAGDSLADTNSRTVYKGPADKAFSKSDDGIFDTDNNKDSRIYGLFTPPAANSADDKVLVVQNPRGPRGSSAEYGYIYKDKDGKPFFFSEEKYAAGERPTNTTIDNKVVKIDSIKTVTWSTNEDNTITTGEIYDQDAVEGADPVGTINPASYNMSFEDLKKINLVGVLNKDTDSEYYVLLRSLDLGLESLDSDSAGVTEVTVYDKIRSLTIGTQISTGNPNDTINLTNLPYPAKYTITELASDYHSFDSVIFAGGESNVLLSGENVNPVIIGLYSDANDESDASVTLTFKNKTTGDIPDSPGSGIVNRYENGKLVYPDNAS